MSVGVRPVEAVDVELIQEGPAGLGRHQLGLAVLLHLRYLDGASAILWRVVDLDLEAGQTYGLLFPSPPLVDDLADLGDFQLKVKLLQLGVLLGKEWLHDRQLFAVTGVSRTVTKYCIREKMVKWILKPGNLRSI